MFNKQSLKTLKTVLSVKTWSVSTQKKVPLEHEIVIFLKVRKQVNFKIFQVCYTYQAEETLNDNFWHVHAKHGLNEGKHQ